MRFSRAQLQIHFSCTHSKKDYKFVWPFLPWFIKRYKPNFVSQWIGKNWTCELEKVWDKFHSFLVRLSICENHPRLAVQMVKWSTFYLLTLTDLIQLCRYCTIFGKVLLKSVCLDSFFIMRWVTMAGLELVSLFALFPFKVSYFNFRHIQKMMRN